MKDLNFFLSASPANVQEALRYGTVSLAAYRVGREFKLLRSPVPFVDGGLLEADMSGFTGFGPHRALVDQLIRECRLRGLRGMVLKLPRPTVSILAFCRELESESARRDLTLWLPESYGRTLHQARLVLPGMCLGGTFEGYIRRKSELYGAERLALRFDMAAAEFALPALSGRGVPVSRRVLEELPERGKFYSKELCVFYASRTFRGRAYVTLWEEGRSIGYKLALAGMSGVRSFFFPWPESGEICGDIIFDGGGNK